jgi:hypothetical protein
VISCIHFINGQYQQELPEKAGKRSGRQDYSTSLLLSIPTTSISTGKGIYFGKFFANPYFLI